MLAAIVALAAGLRIHGTGRHELCFDEAISARMAAGTVGEIMRGEHSPKTPPLYPLALNAWARVFGESEVALRGLSVLFGVLFVSGLGLAGAAHYSRGAGLAAAGAAAVAPLCVFYSQHARCYAMLMLIALVFFHYTLRLGGRGSGGSRAGFLLSGCALLYTHACGFFLLPAAPLYFLLLRKWRAVVSSSFLAGAAVLAGAVFWVPAMSAPPHAMHPWIDNLWNSMGPGGALASTLESHVLWGRFPDYLAWRFGGAGLSIPALLHRLPVAGTVITVIYGAAIFAALAWLARKETSHREKIIAAAVFAAFPVAAMYAASELWKTVYLPGRTDTVAVPALFLLAGIFYKSSNRIIAAALAVWLCVASFGALKEYYERPPDRNFAIMLDIIDMTAGSGGGVVCTERMCEGLEYYSRRDGGGHAIIPFPARRTMIELAHSPKYYLGNPERIVRDAAGVAAESAAALEAGEKLVVLVHNRDYARVNRALFAMLGHEFEYETTIGAGAGLRFFVFRRK